MNRLNQKYKETVVPALMKKFELQVSDGSSLY